MRKGFISLELIIVVAIISIFISSCDFEECKVGAVKTAKAVKEVTEVLAVDKLDDHKDEEQARLKQVQAELQTDELRERLKTANATIERLQNQLNEQSSNNYGSFDNGTGY